MMKANQSYQIDHKMERRRHSSSSSSSSTSESSVEPMDLGRTPKKKTKFIPSLNTLPSTNTIIKTDLINTTTTTTTTTTPLKSSSSINESELYESEDNSDGSGSTGKNNNNNGDGSKTSNANELNYKRNNRFRERHVHIELSDNPNSLRKKFRISTPYNRNSNNNNNNNNNSIDNSNLNTNNNNKDSNNVMKDTNAALIESPTTTASAPVDHSNNNESGFIDASSHQLNSSPEPMNNSDRKDRDDVKYVCPICEVVSATPHEFTNHIRCHNYSSGDSENFTCRICSKILSSASSLDRHVLVHTGERPFNCKYCHLTFTTNGNMHRHMRTHKEHQHHRKRGGGNSNNNNSSNNNNNHNNNNNNKNVNNSAENSTSGSGPESGGGGDVESYESDACSTDSNASCSNNNNNNNCNTNNNINNNNNNHLKRRSIDDDCTGTMKRRIKTTINNNNIINENDIEPNIQQISMQKYCCPVCNRNDFISMLLLGTHMDREHPGIPAKCRQCDTVFKTHKLLNAHRCLNKINITQGFKDIDFVDFSSEKFPLIAKSLCEQTIRTSITSQKFECPKCFRAFPCASSVDIHAKDCGEIAQDYSMQKRAISESSSEEENRRDEFFAHLDLQNKSIMSYGSTVSSPQTSEKSDKDYYDKVQVKIEQNHDPQQQQDDQHNQEQDDQQNQDKVQLNHKYSFKSQQHHQYPQESKDLADIQSILNMTSSSNSLLSSFEKCVNTPNSDFIYNKDEEEAQDDFLAEFRKMKLRGEFPCKLCTAVFPNLRALKGHNRIHLTAAGAGPYRCNMCPYTINDKAALIRHMRTHNGDRPYECASCNYAFTTKANCERHLRNRHGKTTREEVKRSIIYHPSEDSSCEDPMKKIHLFSSPEVDHDEEHHAPRDRSTPVSHLKEMLQNNKPVKIQVKSLEKLIDKASHTYECGEKNYDIDSQIESNRPIDLSMDVLDLSKKSNKSNENNIEEKRIVAEQQPLPEESIINVPTLDKTHLIFAQQQFLNDTLPKLDPAHLFQFSQLYRNMQLFPPIHPFLLSNSLMPNINDLAKFPPGMLINPLFRNSEQPPSATTTQQISSAANLLNRSQTQPIQSQLLNKAIIEPTFQLKSSQPSALPTTQILQKSLTQPQVQPPPPPPLPPPSLPALSASTTSSQISTVSSHSPMTRPSSQPPLIAQHQNSTGPVKMVIKNGVLMPKQKQRRYRTERPFSCEHCSARFTLRSNMERHIKQQHPQYWSQRQRSGHHVLRRGHNTSAIQHSMPPISPQIPPQSASNLVQNFNSISDQVKYALLAQQLKARKDSDMLQHTFAQNSLTMANSSSTPSNNPGTNADSYQNENNPVNANISNLEDDDPKLVIDEKDEQIDEYEIDDDDDEEENDEDCEDIKPEDLSKQQQQKFSQQPNKYNLSAKKVAESILEQAIKQGSNTINNSSQNQTYQLDSTKQPRDVEHKEINNSFKATSNMITKAESVGKFLKEVASSSFKDDNSDLVSVSKLVDNATNSLQFNNYFQPSSDSTNHLEQSDEEGLVASGSASESNNSGTEEGHGNGPEPKKKSAYSLAPNRVACPYCQRMFPWSSSLRRHILTHTGQKPFKCSHCPLLFTTKSNCDRHLLRKHGNVESAVSLYVPIDDIPDPTPIPKERIEKEQEAATKCAIPIVTTTATAPPPPTTTTATPSALNLQIANFKNELPIASSDLPFKCHLCDSSFSERNQCLDHIKIHHVQEFALLLAKGAIDAESDFNNHIYSAEDDDNNKNPSCDGRGKYPDYTNRKVICAFCMRRFWSTEDLRRHMRTHSGERPFQCDVCLRKFTLKHSMLRHMKKHSKGHHVNQSNQTNSGSDVSDDEQPSMILTNALRNHKIEEILNKTGTILRQQYQQQIQLNLNKKDNNDINHRSILKSFDNKDNNTSGIGSVGITSASIVPGEENSDLIGNLLGISDQGILNKLLSSADEAAKLLGVDK